MTNFDALLSGYRRFRETGWTAQRERWAELAEGQSPKLMVIACSDSRTDPSLIFDTAPGEMFVVRNVGNLVPPFETDGSRHGVSAALEFAVKVLQVEEIIVLGHGYCGGCAAALTRQFTGLPPGEGGFIAHWIDLLDEARDAVLAEHPKPLDRAAFRAMEHAAVKVSLANLRSFPCIPESETSGALRLRGAFFAISDGVLHLLDEETGTFAPA